jgi:hypothetical protein
MGSSTPGSNTNTSQTPSQQINSALMQSRPLIKQGMQSFGSGATISNAGGALDSAGLLGSMAGGGGADAATTAASSAIAPSAIEGSGALFGTGAGLAGSGISGAADVGSAGLGAATAADAASTAASGLSSAWGGPIGIAGNLAGSWLQGTVDPTHKGNSIGNMGGAALKGAGTGAAIGSIIPGVGTAIGAGVGGLAGLLSTFF